MVAIMGKDDFLVEIGCEDMPLWTGSYLQEKWVPVIERMLKENRIEYASLRFFHTSRRIILCFNGISPMQSDIITEISGPPVEAGIDEKGNFTAAAKGFAKSHNVKVQELLIKEKKGRKVLALQKKEKGRAVKKIAGNIIVESMRNIEIPRAMKWKKQGFKFVRPVRWILALMGSEIVKIEIGDVKSGRYSFGHRVLSPEKFRVSSPKEYFEKALKNFVVFDKNLRLEFVKAALKKELPADTAYDESRLAEILNTVEYPLALKCSLKKEYMDIPPEVVSAVILKLNGIPIYDKNGELQPFCISVTDGVKSEDITGNYLSVLSSKMDDAIFFMKQDMSLPFSGYTENLKKISYHPRWGSVYDRVARFKKIAAIVLEYIDVEKEAKENVYSIISLCKNDLSTLMVAEFPSLEGIIGRIYAEKNGFNEIIAKGIEQHYFPKSSDGRLPDSIEASVVSLVARIESLCGMFLDNIEIKGTGDPYGVKKIANGLIEISWNKKFCFPLKTVVSRSLQVFVENTDDTLPKIVSFLLQRVENILAAEEFSPGIRKAVILAEKENLLNIRLKTDSLKKFFSGGQGHNVLVPFIRVANILKQAEEKKIAVAEKVNEEILCEEMERKLYDFYRKTENSLKNSYKNGEYLVFLEKLTEWRSLIDKFFDEILVMCNDEKMRSNRLSILKQINDIFSLFADFSLIPIVEVENA